MYISQMNSVCHLHMSSHFSAMTIAELKKYAKDINVYIAGLNKQDIISTITNAEATKYKRLFDQFTLLSKRVDVLEIAQRNNLAKKREKRFFPAGEMFVMPRKKLTKLIPLDHSLQNLFDKGYDDDESDDEGHYDGDDEYDTSEGYQPYDGEDDVDPEILDEELDEIQKCIDNHHQFKIPSEIYNKAIQLDRFVANSSAAWLGDKLCIGKECIILDSDRQKATMIIASTKLTFIYYNNEWLVSADWV
jgi:Rho termination factor, N-terminal domain